MKKQLYILLLTFFLIPHPSSLFSQTYNFRNYSVDDGLPFVEVSSIFQDSKGYLWTGGYGGLSRFDGKNFVNYAPKDGLADHYVNCIAESGKHELWVGTISGLSIFNGKKFRNYTVKDGLPSNQVNVLFRTKLGITMVGTDKGLAFYNSSDTGFVTDDNKGPGFTSCTNCKWDVLPDLNIRAITGSNGIIWVGTGKGVTMRNEYEPIQKNYSIKEGLCCERVNALAVGKGVWVGTDSGLGCLVGERFVNYHLKDGLPDEKINSLTVDSKGIVWIGTDKGLCRYDGKTFFTYSISENINSNNIHSLYTDYEGNLWIGTFAGMYKHRDDAFISFTKKDGLTTTFVYPILRGRHNDLWVGTNQGGLFRYNQNKFTAFTIKDGLAGNTINACWLDRDSTIWIGTDKGLSKMIDANGRITFQNYFVRDGLISDSVTYIIQDKNGLFWLGGHAGVTTFDPKAPPGQQFKKIPFAAPYPDFDVWYIKQDSKGVIWFGTYLGGLFRYEGGIVHYFNDERKDFQSRSVFGVQEDEAGNLYFGTLEGVKMYNGKEFVQFSESDGLNSDLVYLISLDEGGGTLWVGTNQGLNKIDIAEFKRTGKKQIEPYGKEEGFLGVECNSAGVFREKNGDIWFGTVNGLIRYSPSEYLENDKEARINITGFRIFYNDTALTNNVALNWYDNNISFDFIGICLTNPAKVRYSFMLEGSETGWSPETKNTFARFSNLGPGTYTFKVKSRNNEGKWNISPAAFTFTVLTPWWKTWWFRIFLITGVVSGVYLAVRFRVRQIEVNEHNKVRLANNELKALRAQMNPHFIFNALNSIQHFIMSSDEQGASKYLNKFAKLIRSILNNTEKTSVSLKDEVESLRLYIELEMLRFESKFDYDIRVDSNTDLDFYEVPTLLIQPYVENAIIHGLVPKKEKGKLDIEMKIENNFILCTINDNGIGRERSSESKANSVKRGHKSLGMKITRDRLELLNSVHNSSLSVNITDLYGDNGEAAGTKVEIFIPIV
jgi:ligand-binding sensor domain-containing protein